MPRIDDIDRYGCVCERALREIVAVLGTGPCSQCACEGCAYEFAEAARLAREALESPPSRGAVDVEPVHPLLQKARGALVDEDYADVERLLALAVDRAKDLEDAVCRQHQGLPVR